MFYFQIFYVLHVPLTSKFDQIAIFFLLHWWTNFNLFIWIFCEETLFTMICLQKWTLWTFSICLISMFTWNLLRRKLNYWNFIEFVFSSCLQTIWVFMKQTHFTVTRSQSWTLLTFFDFFQISAYMSFILRKIPLLTFYQIYYCKLRTSL